MANITIVQAIQQVAQAGKDYTDKIAADKVSKITGKGLSTNDLTNDLLANYNAAYTHSQATHAPSNAQKNSDITKAEIEAKLTGNIATHTHSYAGSSSAGGAATSANKVNTNLVIKLNSGSTEDSNLFTFNGSTAKTINITPGTIGASVTGHTHDDRYYTESEVDTKLAGKADNEHGTHVTYGTTTTSLSSGGTTGAVGSSTKVAREDHTHTLPAYPTALKNPNAVKIQLNGGTTEGTNQFTYDGSDAKTINITASSVGAAPSSHTSDTTVHITATERSTWNAKASTATATTSANGLMSSTDKSKLDGIASGANKYVHPDTHAATMIVQDSDHRFVTDAEIDAWDAKSNLALGETSGTAYRGDRGKIAYDHSQSDHNFAGSSSKGGAANSVKSSITVKLNSGTTEGTNMFTFNGSTAKTIDITPAAIGASDSGHNHDNRYYTESEINTKINTINSSISTALSDAQAYADAAIAELVDSAPEAMNTLNELAIAIDQHQDVYEAYVAEVSAALDKKANSSHGTHVTYSTSAPAANGTASAGSANNVSRGDHVHPLQTSVSGNAGSANKVNKSMVVKLNSGTTEGTDMFTFDGSATKSINITSASIGAAASSHGTHLTLGTGSGNAFRGDYGNTAYNHSQADHAPSDAQKNQNAFSNVKVGDVTVAADTATDTLTIAAGNNITITPDATNDKITIAATDTIYTHPSHTAYESGLYKVTVNSLGHVTAATAVTSTDISNLGVKITDNDYRVKTTQAQTTKLYLTGCTGATTGELKYDGSVYLDTTAGHLTATQFNGALVGNVTGNVSGSSGSCTGNAATASKAAQLTTARDITIGNQTKSFNGTAAISFDLASIGVEQISDDEVASIISTVFGA